MGIDDGVEVEGRRVQDGCELTGVHEFGRSGEDVAVVRPIASGEAAWIGAI
jgi:hypothetical protein